MDENNRKLSRREFIQAGLWGGAGAAACLGGWPDFVSAAATGSSEHPAPVYRTLGRTGLKITVVSFGAMLTPESEVIRAGLDQGINYIDTARRYMNGKNEGIVAQAIKGRRDTIYLATKVRPASRTKKEIFRDVEESLTELQTDHVDVIQLHNLTGKDKERAFLPEVREALVKLRQEGKVRFFGVTTHTDEAEVVNALVDDPDHFFDTVLVKYNFTSGRGVKEAIARAAQGRHRGGGHEDPGRRLSGRGPGWSQSSPGRSKVGPSGHECDGGHPGNEGSGAAQRGYLGHGSGLNPA